MSKLLLILAFLVFGFNCLKAPIPTFIDFIKFGFVSEGDLSKILFSKIERRDFLRNFTSVNSEIMLDKPESEKLRSSDVKAAIKKRRELCISWSKFNLSQALIDKLLTGTEMSCDEYLKYQNEMLNVFQYYLNYRIIGKLGELQDKEFIELFGPLNTRNVLKGHVAERIEHECFVEFNMEKLNEFIGGGNCPKFGKDDFLKFLTEDLKLTSKIPENICGYKVNKVAPIVVALGALCFFASFLIEKTEQIKKVGAKKTKNRLKLNNSFAKNGLCFGGLATVLVASGLWYWYANYP